MSKTATPQWLVSRACSVSGLRRRSLSLPSRAAMVVAGLFGALQFADAQTPNESFEIGLSTDRIAITSDFSGARLVVFGALDNADAKLLRQQRYDIVVALVGPRRRVVVREKERTLGLWINRGSESFNSVPASYALASTRPLGDITREGLRVSLSMGIEDMRLNTGPTLRPNGTPVQPTPSGAAPDAARPAPPASPTSGMGNDAIGSGAASNAAPMAQSTNADPQSAPVQPPSESSDPASSAKAPPLDEALGTRANRDRYATALRRIRQTTGLYNQSFGSVEFVSPTLFRADLRLPADLPVGQHMVRAYLFRSGVYIREQSEPLIVVKTGFESVIDEFAARHGFLYGLFAVALAIFTGWFGRIVFKRD